MLGKEIAEILEEINPMIVKHFHSPHEVSLKPDESIVTKTDREVEKILIPKLMELLPGSKVVGEESAAKGTDNVDDFFECEYLWAVDPIDGTVNFTSGLPLFTVSIGLFKRKNEGYEPVTGAISFPVLSDIYFTHGEKTLLKKIDSKSVSEINRKENESVSNLLIPNHFIIGKDVDKKNRFASNVRLLGSTAADMLFVSVGKASATVTVAHIWDVAGALAIAKTQNIFPRELSTGIIRKTFSKDDFYYGEPRYHWRLKKPLVLCNEDSFADVQELLVNGQ